MFKEFCEQLPDPVPQLTFYEETKKYEALDTPEDRMKAAKDIYDKYVMKELLSHTHTYSKEAVDHVQKHLMKGDVPSNLFEPYIEEIFNSLRGDLFDQFIQRSVTGFSSIKIISNLSLFVPSHSVYFFLFLSFFLPISLLFSFYFFPYHSSKSRWNFFPKCCDSYMS